MPPGHRSHRRRRSGRKGASSASAASPANSHRRWRVASPHAPPLLRLAPDRRPAGARPARLRLGQPARRAPARRTARARAASRLKKIGSFDHPVYVAGAPGFPKLLFVVEQPGRVVVLNGGKRLSRTVPRPARVGRLRRRRARPALDRLPARLPPERQLLRLLQRHRPATSASTNSSARSATRAAAGSQRQVIEIPHPVNANHNGGQMQFLDDLLYFGTGDGGSGGDPPNNAQNKEVLLGKLLRIDPRPSGGQPYSVPSSNPFVGKPGRDEIYSYGLRNPFRFSFDTVSAAAAADRDRRRRPEQVRGARLHDRRGRRAAPTSAGTHSRASPPTRKKTAAPPTQAAPPSRSSPTPTAAAAAARSSAATSSATAACALSISATSTPTSARASCAASSLT